jgi:transposase
LLDCSPEYVRGVIHAFNRDGFAALDPKWSAGRPKAISDQVRRQVCLTARCCPRDLGLAFSTWSLTKLAEYLATAGIARVSRESIRQILHGAGIRWLATKTWKASTDPQFIEKMHRVLELYDNPPAGGRVICADENTADHDHQGVRACSVSMLSELAVAPCGRLRPPTQPAAALMAASVC